MDGKNTGGAFYIELAYGDLTIYSNYNTFMLISYSEFGGTFSI
jgi:hypothetical protein